MVRLKNDPFYNLMIRAASSISIESCLPAFVALLSSLEHWRKTELHDTHPYRFVFIQMFFNKDNYRKDFTSLQQSVFLDTQTIRKYWDIFRQNFFEEYKLCKNLPQHLLISRFLLFLYDRDFCKLIHPYRFFTINTFLSLLSEINIPEADKQFYLRLLDSDSSIKPFTYEELYNETAISKDE